MGATEGGLRIARFIYDCPLPWLGLSPGPYEMSRAQAERGHRVTVFCGGWPSKRPEPIPGARVVNLPKAIKGAVFLTSGPALLVRFALHRLFHEVDLVHGHAQLPQWYSLWRRLAGRVDRTPYFFHLHVTFAGRGEAYRAKGIRLGAWERLLHSQGLRNDLWGCRAADHVFASSDTVKEEAVRHYGVDPGRITVVGNGVNTRLFSPAPRDAALSASLGLGPEDEVIVYAGVLNPRKNIEGLLAALALLPGRCKLVLAGSGQAAYVKALEERARAEGVAARVRFAGYVAYPDLPRYYNLGHAFALPSLYEGFPKVLLEALACGKPAVVHRGYAIEPGIDAYLDHADCQDPADLAAALAAALARGFKGDRGDFAARYSWHAIAARMEAVYRERMGGRP